MYLYTISTTQLFIDATSPHLLAESDSDIMAGNNALVWIDCEVSQKLHKFRYEKFECNTDFRDR